MPQTRRQKYNPVTRKYEWVDENTSTDVKRTAKPKTTETDQLTKWLRQFDSTVGKPKRNNDDYSFLIRRQDGLDVTPTALNQALSKGLIDNKSYRRRLEQYQNVKLETAKTPMPDSTGKPAQYTDSTGKQRTFLRSQWIDNGTYNYNQSFSEVAAKQQQKRATLGTQLEQAKKEQPWETWEGAKYLGQRAKASFNQHFPTDVATGAYKGIATNAVDVIGATENIANKLGTTLFGTADEAGAIKPDTWKVMRATIANALDKDDTPEDRASKIGRIVAGEVTPTNMHQAVGMQGVNFGQGIGAATASTLAAQALGPEIGVPVAVMNGLNLVGQVGGAAMEYMTGDSRWNWLGNPMGAVRKVGGEYTQGSEEALGQSHEMASATGPLMIAAGLIATLATKKPMLATGTYKDSLKSAVKEIKHVSAAAIANKSVNEMTAGAKGMGIGVKPLPNTSMRDALTSISPFAVEAASNMVVPALQTGYHIADPEKNPLPNAEDVVSSAAFMLYPRANPNSIVGKLNTAQHAFARDAEIKYQVRAQHKANVKELFKKAPVLSHLNRNLGLSVDQALAYVSHELGSFAPVAEFPANIDQTASIINQLPTARRLAASEETGRFQRAVDPEILKAVNGSDSPVIDRMLANVDKRGVLANRPVERPSVYDQVNEGLRPYTNIGREMQLDKVLRIVRNTNQPDALTPESVGNQLNKNQRQIPMASMVMDVDSGQQKKFLYSHDLNDVFVTDDINMPTHELHPDTQELQAGHLPKENIPVLVAKMNQRQNAQIEWSYKTPEGTILRYQFVGFKGGRIIVRKSNNNVHTVVGLSPREFELTVPESKKEQIMGLEKDLSEAAGTLVASPDNTSVTNYTRTDFRSADRDLYPSTIFEGNSTRANRGALPARKISNSGAFNTYQLPDGAVIRISKVADTASNAEQPVLPPIDARMETVIGSRYAGNLYTQARVKADHPHYYDVTLENGTEKRVYVSAKQQKDIAEIANVAAEKLSNADITGEDRAYILNDVNSKILTRLLKYNSSGIPDDGVVKYNEHFNNQPIHVGDVVQFVDYTDADGKTRRSILQRAGHEKGVVVQIDHNGVHVKLANEIPGLIASEGGRTVLVHPDTLAPVLQPHLHQEGDSIIPIKNVADIESYYKTGKPVAAETDINDTGDVAVDDNTVADTTAEVLPKEDNSELLYGPERSIVISRLKEEGTVEHVRKTILDVSQDKLVTPKAMADGIVNILNDDAVSMTHKETIIHSLLSLDLDPVTDLNQLSKLNHALSGVSDWVTSANRPVNYINDISTMLSGDVLDVVSGPKSIHEQAMRILHNWNTVNVANALKQYFRNNPDIDLASRKAIERQVISLSRIVPRLRTFLNGRGLIHPEAWRKIARLTPQEQNILLDSLEKTAGKGQDVSRKPFSNYTLTNINDAIDFAGLKPSQTLPNARTATRASYEALVKSEIDAFKQRLATIGTTAAVREIAKPNGNGDIASVNAFLQSLTPDVAKVVQSQVFESLRNVDIPEESFNTLFQNIRFPGSPISVAEVASHVKNNTLDQFIEASNLMRGSAMALNDVEGMTYADLQELISPFVGFVPDDVYQAMERHIQDAFDMYTGRRSANATPEQKRIGFVNALNSAITLGLKNSKSLEVSQAFSEEASKLYDAISKRTYQTLQMSADRQAARTRALELTQGRAVPHVAIDRQAVSDLNKALFNLNADNLVEHTPPDGMTVEELATLRKAHEETNQWLGEYGQPALTTVPVRFPFSDIPIVGAEQGLGHALELPGSVAFNKEGLVAAFKAAMKLPNDVSPEVKAVVDQLAVAYADAYDLHTYAYAARHAEYEFKTGNSPDANAQVISILESFRQVAKTQAQRDGIATLISRVQNGEPLFIVRESGRSARNLIHEVFADDPNFGEKLSMYIYTSRIATLQRDFYKDNGRLVITSAGSTDGAGPLFQSFGSLTFQSMNSAGGRAAVNLFLHLNRTANRSRDILSIGHELHHGLFHTMPLRTKLYYAKDVLDAVISSFKLDKASGAKLEGAQADIVNARDQLQREIDILNKTKANLKKVRDENPNDTRAQEAYDQLVFESEVDMHADTSHVLYRNPIINEMVVSSLITGSMGMKPLYSNTDFTVAYTSSNIFSRMGAFAINAIQLMKQQSRAYTSDYSLRNTTVGAASASHNWKLRFNSSFAIKDANGKAKFFGRLPADATVSFVTNNARGLPVFPTFKIQNGKLIPTDAKQVAGAREVVPPQAYKRGIESHTMEVYGNYVAFKDKATSLNALRNQVPAFEIDGVKFYALDSLDGIFTDSVNGKVIKASDIASLKYGLINPTKGIAGIVSVVDPSQLFNIGNVRITGTTEGFNSTLSGLMYDLYARNNVVQTAAIGQGDYAAYNAMKKRIATAGLNIDALPSVNLSGRDPYATDSGSAVLTKSPLDASNGLQRLSHKTRNMIMDWIYQQPADVQKDFVVKFNQSIDNLRRQLFGLDNDDFPLRVNVIDKGFLTTQYSPSVVSSENGNIRSLPNMFNVGRYGNTDAVFNTVKEVASIANQLTPEQKTNLVKAILNSPNADAFEMNVIDPEKGLGAEGGAFLNKLLDSIGRNNVNDEGGLNSVLYGLRELATSALDPLLANETPDVDAITTMFDRINGNDSEWTPNFGAQRDFVLGALQAAAIVRKTSPHELLESIENSPAGVAALSFMSTANAMAMDAGYRAAAMRSYDQFELFDVRYVANRKSPDLILRNKGTEHRFSKDMPSDLRTSAFISIEQETGMVRPAVPIYENGVISGWTVIPTKFDQSAGLGGSFPKDRFPTTTSKNVNEINWSMRNGNPDVEGNKTRDTFSFESGTEWYDTPLFDSLANTDAVAIATVKNMIEEGFRSLGNRAGTKTFEATVPLYIVSGTSPTGGFDASLKPANMIELFSVLNDYQNKYDGIPDGNLQLRHISLSVEFKPGKADKPSSKNITFTDHGSVHTADIDRRTLGTAFLQSMPLASFETYVARQLIAIETMKDFNGESNFFTEYGSDKTKTENFTATEKQTPVSRQNIKFENGRREMESVDSWKDWKGNSLFSDGYDGDDFAFDMSKPFTETQDQLVDSEKQDVNVIHDPTLKPDAIAIDVDKGGVVQVRGGGKQVGWHKAGTYVSTILNEIDGFFRTSKLSGDLSVANNQSWFLSNFFVAAEHALWASKNKLDPNMMKGPLLNALGAWKTMAPNAPGQLYGALKNRGIKNTRFGDHFAHLFISDLVNRVPECNLELMRHYGLNLEYLKWYREYTDALSQNPDLEKTDIPLQMRLNEYFGESKYVQKIFPGVSPVERYNALWKDIAAITEFQKRYLETAAMTPPDHMIQGISQYRDKQLFDSAEAINLLQGMQKGNVSPNKVLAFGQRVLHKNFTSAPYRRSRLLLTPIIGRMIYGSKLGANKISNALFSKDIANISLEKRVFNDATDGGFTPEVKKYLTRRLWMGFLASRANALALGATSIAAALYGITSGNEDRKRKGISFLIDDLVLGNSMVIDKGDQHYTAPLPGGMSSGIKQINQVTDPTPKSVQQLPDWLWRQYIENQLGPTLQAGRTAVTGKDFNQNNAWEQDPNYPIWREQFFNDFPYLGVLKNVLPPALSRFATSLMPIHFTDVLKDVELKRQGNFARGNKPTKPEDVSFDYYKTLVNMFGAGLTNRDDKYIDWVKDNVPGTRMSRYDLIKVQKENAPSHSISDEFKEHGLSGVLLGNERVKQ